MGSIRFIKVLIRPLMFWAVLSHSDAFWSGLSSSERSLYVLKCPLKFWRFSQSFRGFFMDFQWF